MKLFGQIIKVAALAVVCGTVGLANAYSLNKDGEWTTKVSVKKGATHTFWVTGLSQDTGPPALLGRAHSADSLPQVRRGGRAL